MIEDLKAPFKRVYDEKEVNRIVDVLNQLNEQDGCWYHCDKEFLSTVIFFSDDKNMYSYVCTVSYKNILLDMFFIKTENILAITDSENFIYNTYYQNNIESFTSKDILSITVNDLVDIFEKYVSERALYYLMYGENLLYQKVLNFVIPKISFLCGDSFYYDYDIDLQDALDDALNVIMKEIDVTKIEAYNYLLRLIVNSEHYDSGNEFEDFYECYNFDDIYRLDRFYIQDELFFFTIEFVYNPDEEYHYLFSMEVDAMSVLLANRII